MLLGRVQLTTPGVRRVWSGGVWTLRHLNRSPHNPAHRPETRRLSELRVFDMQPGSAYCGPEEEEEGGGLEEEQLRRVIKMKKAAPLHPVNLETKPLVVMDTPACVEPGSSQKKNKRRTRRDKRKPIKIQMDSPGTLASELPFALTSPAAWKELGFTSPESDQKKRKRKRGDSSVRVESEEDAKKRKESQRPNYFVSIRITNTEISSAVVEVQEAVLQQEPRLARAMIPAPTLHITLLVTHLANQEEVDLATATLAGAEPSLAELLGGRGLVLPFSGMGHFRKEVVFIGLGPGPHRHTLDSLAELLRRRFEEQGLLQGDYRGFEPHLTIMKLSRASKLRSQGIKRVDPALYSSYTDRFFGDQKVEQVDLCSMLKKKQEDGYYHTESSLQLGLVQSPLHGKRTSGRRRSAPDEAELLRVSRRLVDDAVSRALQQYKQETLQNGGGPNATAALPPENKDETAPKTDAAATGTAAETDTTNACTDTRK
ncbi:A-kinase anchor protein 7 isoform X2 [Genypterus blacodes]|uniref:A-kinase anchor protein 7 isoform X2 n=1 Tax=Genypterus blacodes TaxID=154954 RepID=UPI003F776D58